LPESLVVPFYITFYHIIWTTQNRQPLINRENEGAVIDAIDEYCEKTNCKLYAIGCMPDHVHLTLSIPPRYAVLDWVNEAKAKSATAVHVLEAKPGDPFAWSRECGIITFGSQNRDKMVRYVKRQKAVHAEGATIDALERGE
jgi:REP element-mobilizing transposase RayT